MSNNLNVNVHENNVGELSKEGDKYIFSYTQDNADYISLTMPCRKEQYINKNLHPIFEMHLPEGYLLSIIKKHFSKIIKTDDFGMLKLMSSSINGRITYNSKHNNKKNTLSLEQLLNPSTENLFEELVSKFALNLGYNLKCW